MKTCSKCKIEKDESEFSKDKRLKSGLVSKCKKCCYEYYKSFSLTEKRKEYNKEYHKKYRKNEKNKDKINENKKKYDNSEKGKKTKSKYKATDKYKEIVKKHNSTEKHREILRNTPSAIRACLGLKNIAPDQIPPELLDLKRIQLQIKRELKNGVQNENKN